MPNSNFQSESYKLFHNFHTQLNNYVKISTASIDNLYNFSSDKEQLANKINDLILNSGERWTPKTYKNPTDEIIKTKKSLAQTSIMWVFSSFDVFLNHVHSTISDYKSDNEIEKVEEYSDVIRLNKLFKSYEWDIDELSYLLPCFEFYSLARHCIVHNMGKPSKELRDILQSKKFIDAISGWPTKLTNGKLSPAPTLTTLEIELMPHHAITYSEVCFRIVKIINKNIYKTVGLDFYIKKIIKNHIIDSSTIEKPYSNNVYNYIINKMQEKYGIKKIQYSEIKKAITDEAELKKINKIYNDKKNIR